MFNLVNQILHSSRSRRCVGTVTLLSEPFARLILVISVQAFSLGQYTSQLLDTVGSVYPPTRDILVYIGQYTLAGYCRICVSTQYRYVIIHRIRQYSIHLKHIFFPPSQKHQSLNVSCSYQELDGAPDVGVQEWSTPQISASQVRNFYISKSNSLHFYVRV